MNLMIIVTHTTAFKMIFKIFFINISKGDVLHTHTQKKKKMQKSKIYGLCLLRSILLYAYIFTKELKRIDS